MTDASGLVARSLPAGRIACEYFTRRFVFDDERVDAPTAHSPRVLKQRP